MEDQIVGSLMSREVKTVRRYQKVRAALQKMVSANIGSVVVVEGEKPVGILTERDITRLVAADRDVKELAAEDVMSSPLITITPEASATEAFRIMDSKRIRRLPVLDGEKLAGIITSKDLVRWALLREHPNYKPDQLTTEELERVFIGWE